MSRSIQQLPSNSGTTSITEVYTATGFNAGDPVYFQNGDYKNPANLPAPSSVNFNFASQAPYNTTGNGGSIAPAFSYTQMQDGISGGTPRRFAAVLSNGNIVQAFNNYAIAPTNPSRIHFRIVSPTGTVVVSPTVVSTTFTSTSYTSVNVVALTGGGFAVAWINTSGGTSNSVNYAIYDNSGTVVTAATQDTSFAAGASYCALEMTRLANGGFAVAMKNTSAVMFIRAYGATGIGAYATISTGYTAAGNSNSFGFVSRSDSSVCFFDNTNSTTYAYGIYSSSGTTLVSPTTFSVTSTTIQGGPDASVLSDGTTIVFGYYNTLSSNVAPCLRFLPTGDVLGSEVVGIPNANLFVQHYYSGNFVGVIGITGNNVMLVWSDGWGNMQYAFYNSSGTCISGSNSTGAIPLNLYSGFAPQGNRITLLESSGSVYAYWCNGNSQKISIQQTFCRISTSTYSIIPVTSVAGSTVSVTGQPTGAVISSSINPNSLSYYSTASSSTVVTNTPTTISGPVVLNASACDAIASCSLPNGGFVIAYRNTNSNVVLNVYSQNAGLVTSITVSGTFQSSVSYSVKICALSGGGFAVAWSQSSTVIALQVYSSAYALSASTTITQYSFNTQYIFDVCGLQGNTFAIIWSVDGTNAAVRIYNSGLTNLQQFDFAGTPSGFACAGNAWGGFAVSYFSGGQGLFRSYAPTASNTWAQATLTSWSMGAFVQNPQMVCSQSGMYVITSYNSSYPNYGMLTDIGATNISYCGALSSWPLGSTYNPTSHPMMGIGMTGNGNIVVANADTTSIGIGVMAPQVTWSPGQPAPYQQTAGSGSPPMFSNSAYNTTSIGGDTASQPRITPLTGNNCLITFRGTSNYPSYIIVNGTSNSQAYVVTAGTTASSLVPIAPVTGSGVITGVLAGIAVTNASAGSTGQLATNGQVLLGASYTSTATGAFDSTGAAVSGVKGTFNGRSVNLQGNT
jgi:hypothetical protein